MNKKVQGSDRYYCTNTGERYHEWDEIIGENVALYEYENNMFLPTVTNMLEVITVSERLM